jgi:hypothetical protein
VKTASKDKNPGEEIGEGIYDYTIEVLYPNKKEVISGAKGRRATKNNMAINRILSDPSF